MGHSVLQVPVPALEPFVRARTLHYDRDYLATDPRFTHAHVTALAPFRDELDAGTAATVAAIAADTEPFRVRFEQIATFPNGIIHLLPAPDAGFRELTRRLAEAFPDCPPYAGAYGDVQPHLTLDLRAGDVTEASTRAALGELVPCEVRAERLELAWYAAGDCHLRRTWRLGRAT